MNASDDEGPKIFPFDGTSRLSADLNFSEDFIFSIIAVTVLNLTSHERFEVKIS
jgi:hypothetical protein